MTVQELVDLLLRHDPTAPVFLTDPGNGTFDDSIAVETIDPYAASVTGRPSNSVVIW